jgi:hypothetical protein
MSKKSNQSRESQSGGGQVVGGLKSPPRREPGKAVGGDAGGQTQKDFRGKGGR